MEALRLWTFSIPLCYRGTANERYDPGATLGRLTLSYVPNKTSAMDELHRVTAPRRLNPKLIHGELSVPRLLFCRPLHEYLRRMLYRPCAARIVGSIARIVRHHRLVAESGSDTRFPRQGNLDKTLCWSGSGTNIESLFQNLIQVLPEIDKVGHAL